MYIYFLSPASVYLLKNVLIFALLFSIATQLFAVEEIKLDNSLAGASDRFGHAISINADGTIIAIGSPAGFIGSDGAGAVHILELRGGVWLLQEKLIPDDSSHEDFFGISVALSPTGKYLVVGNHADDTACPTDINCNSGAAYVFMRSGNTWVQKQKLMASDSISGSVFGTSVALSEGGNYILVGAPGGGALTPSGTGAAYMFRWNGKDWIEKKIFRSSTGSLNNYFGLSVSMDTHANVLAIGDNHDDSACDNAQDCDAGAVSILMKSGANWLQEELFIGSESNGLGSSVAVSLDGNYIVGGANFVWSGSGYAQVYKFSSGNWRLHDTLLSSDGDSGSWYANSVSINGDGSRVVVGANFADAQMGEEGATYFYQRVADSWTETFKIVASDAEFNDEFGAAVALNNKGDKVVIGAKNKESFAASFPYRGAAYLYTLQTSLGGTADAILINSIICVNQSTGQRIKFQSNSTTWNCEEQGLIVNPSDKVRMTVSGVIN